MNNQTLSLENIAYAGTRGISQNNCHLYFRPAFLDKNSGRIEIAKLKNATDLEDAILTVALAKLDLQKYEEAGFPQMKLEAESEIMLAEEELKRARSDLAGTQELFDKGYSNQNDLDSDKLGVQRKEIDVRNKSTDLVILVDYTDVKQRKELNNGFTELCEGCRGNAWDRW